MWSTFITTTSLLFCTVFVTDSQAQLSHSSSTSIVNQVEDIQLTIPAPSDDLNVYAMPVGQGDCTIIQCPTNGNIAVLDCGSSGGVNRLSPSQVQHYISPQIERVSTIIITHPDRDHFNYLYQIEWDTRDIDAVIIGGTLSDYDRPSSEFTQIYNWLLNFNSMGKLFTVSGGLSCIGNCVVPTGILNFCQNQNIQFNVLAANVGPSSNELSIVMKANVGQWSMLLSGDMEGTAANQIATSLGSQLQSVIYKMAHHGSSRLANRPSWLEAITPNSTFASSAYNFGICRHPRCETITRIENLGTIVQAPQHTFYCGNSPGIVPMQYSAFTQSMFETSPSRDMICIPTYSSSSYIINNCIRIRQPGDDFGDDECPEEEYMDEEEGSGGGALPSTAANYMIVIVVGMFYFSFMV